MKNMREVNIEAIDLNLLVALDALLRERSVSRAATSVGLSQPAMSRALGRLREVMEDPLLVRQGHRMLPTPRALGLVEPVAAAIAAVRLAFTPSDAFDPHTARRRFRLGAVDTTLAVVLPLLLGRLDEIAPGVEVGTAPLRSTADCFDRLVGGEWDLAIGRFPSPPEGLEKRLLFEDRIVCVVRRDHPRIGESLTLDDYVAEAHLSVETGAPDDQPFTIEDRLRSQGFERRVVSRLENLAMAPFVVAQTDLLCTAPLRTIAPFADGLGLRMLELPFETPAFELELAWHASVDVDPANEWLREVIAALFEEDPRG